MKHFNVFAKILLLGIFSLAFNTADAQKQCGISGILLDLCTGTPLGGVKLDIYVNTSPGPGTYNEEVYTSDSGTYGALGKYACGLGFTIFWDGQAVASGVTGIGSAGATISVRPRPYFTVDGFSRLLQESNSIYSKTICETSGEVILRTKPLSFAKKYKITVNADALGTQGSQLYTTGWVNLVGGGCSAGNDLGHLDITSILSSLGDGNYFVNLQVGDCCTEYTQKDWLRIQVDISQTLVIDFNYGASTALEAAVPDGNAGDLKRMRSTNPASPTVCGASSISFKGIDITNNSIQDYKIVISETDCTTGNAISTLFTSGTYTASGGQMPDFDIDAEFIYLPTNRGWFQAATLGEIVGVTTSGKCYKAEVEVTNNCGKSRQQHGFFTIYQGNPNALQSEGRNLVANQNYIRQELESNENSPGSIVVYPNPANSWVEVSDLPHSAEIKISDLAGHILSVEHVKDVNTTRLDLSTLISGYYLIQVCSDTESTTLPLVKY